MKYFEFGKENSEIMVVLHGGGVCYRGAIPVAENMAKRYHVILVAYDGFNPTEPDTEFKSVAYEAKRVADYIVENCNSRIDVLYGVSYGCYVLLDVLADKRLTITAAIADGMPTTDYPDIKNSLLKKIFLFFFTGFAYQMIGKAGPIRKKIVCKAMGRSTEAFDEIVYREATFKSWVNQDDCMIGRHMDFEVFKNADMYIWHGVGGKVDKGLSQNIKSWKDKGYVFNHKVFTGMGHGGLAAEHPDQFFKEVVAAHKSALKKTGNPCMKK